MIFSNPASHQLDFHYHFSKSRDNYHHHHHHQQQQQQTNKV